jgi:hypothetical protein
MGILIPKNNINPVNNPTGTYREALSRNSTKRIFNNFRTNINKIAIAPTYIIQRIIPKYSTPRKNINTVTFANTSTKYHTEFTGLFEVITFRENHTAAVDNK